MPDGYRVERDSLGEVRVPTDALYGAQTQRAIENFPISGQRFGRGFIQALGLLKKAAAPHQSGTRKPRRGNRRGHRCSGRGGGGG